MEPYPGAQIGAYTIERKVGEGAFGAVWCGVNHDTGERVALKVLLEAAAANKEQVSRFHREAELLALVGSPNVARMVDFLVNPEFGVVLVMEFIDGELLSDLLGAGVLKTLEAVDIGAQIIDGVCDLHAKGIIHRDLKPNNIMLCTKPDGSRRVVIFDLGLSRLIRDAGASESTGLTGSHVALGTLECMAPEQILNARDVTERSDIYSVGSILYRAITGYYPFASEDERDLARRKLTVETPEMAVAQDDPIALGLRAIITRATRRRPAQRYEAAAKMREDFQALQAEIASRPAKEPPVAPTPAAAPAKESDRERAQRAKAPTLIIDDRGARSSSNLGLQIGVGLAVFSALVAAALVYRSMHH
jgi:serine/threonine-protein kinase